MMRRNSHGGLIAQTMKDPAAMPQSRTTQGSAARTLSTQTIKGTDGNDVLVGTDGDDVISGLGGDDYLRGLAGNDLLAGGDGNDTLDSGTGQDLLYGEGGVNTVSFAASDSGMFSYFNTADATRNGIFFNTDGKTGINFEGELGYGTLGYFYNIDNFIGSRFGDEISGNALGNELNGGAGSDVVDGGAGDDIIDVGSEPQTRYADTVSRPDIIKSGSTIADRKSTAVLINSGIGGDFDTNLNPEIVSTPDFINQNSQAIPHATVRATGSGTIDMYKIYLDPGFVQLSLTDLRLNNGTDDSFSGTIIMRNEAGDRLDALLGTASEDYQHNFSDLFALSGKRNLVADVNITQAGYFYILVSQPLSSSTTPAIPKGATYTLNVYDKNASVTPTGTFSDGYEIVNGGDASTYDDGKSFFGVDAGFDTVNFSSAASSIDVDLRTRGLQQTGGAGKIQISNIDNITGSRFDDVLTGTDKPNVIAGQDGNDTIATGAGRDTVQGGGGNDVIQGGAGADELHGGDGDDVIDAGFGDQSALVAKPDITKAASLDLGTPNRALVLNTGSGTVFSGVPDPRFSSEAFEVPHVSINATIKQGPPDLPNPGYPGSGTRLDYYAIDVAAGADGSFNIKQPHATPLTILAGLYAENDLIKTLGVGNLSFDQDSATFSYHFDKGGRYYLRIDYNAALIDSYKDPVSSAPKIGDKQYQLNIALSSATVATKPGYDWIDGGNGRDTASFASATTGVTADLTKQGTVQTVAPGVQDLFNGIENLTGSDYGDLLIGSGTANALAGGKGNDTLQGGGSADTLTGGAGNDVFRYKLASDSAPAAPDVITDFVSGQDKIDLTAVHTNVADKFAITTSGGNSFVDVDLGGNGTTDLRIQVNGANALVANDVLWTAGAAASRTG